MTNTKRSGRTLNLGHRGALSLAPENTLAAFAKAREVGADGVELDVQLSADGELVIIHDNTLERTTDGQGAVSAHTLAELKHLDAGGWFDARYTGERIPTLQEVIDTMSGEMFLNIELKGGLRPLRSPSAKSAEGIVQGPAQATRLVECVVECVRRNHYAGRVIISSFELEMLRRVREIAPELAIGVLYSSPPSAEQIAGLHAEALHPEWKLLTEELVPSAHAAGQKVNVWTVNAEADMRNLIALGVDAIITNYPQLLAAVQKETQL